MDEPAEKNGYCSTRNIVLMSLVLQIEYILDILIVVNNLIYFKITYIQDEKNIFDSYFGLSKRIHNNYLVGIKLDNLKTIMTV